MKIEWLVGQSYGAPFIDWSVQDAPLLTMSVESGFASLQAKMSLTPAEVHLLRTEPKRAIVFTAKCYRYVQNSGATTRTDSGLRSVGGVAFSADFELADIVKSLPTDEAYLYDLLVQQMT